MTEKNISCFVAMGYGNKKILGTNIDINLDYIYYQLIKPVLVKKKLKSIYLDDNLRGDEVPTTESINKTFLRSLYIADLVVADISTLNQNAIYELGLRHAMKPKSTIILCDTKTFSDYSFFDISMQPQFTYDYEKMFREPKYLDDLKCKLCELINTCILSDNSDIDSPVFDLDLYEIIPKKDLKVKKNKMVEKSLRELIDEGINYYENKDFVKAEKSFATALDISNDINIFSKYIVSRYKKDISIPNLIKTINYLECKIDLNKTTNENILGNAAAINKYLFRLTKEVKYYEKSLSYYRMGSNYESGNLYCARNYCAMLLKKYLVSTSEEEIKEYFYTAQHNAKIFINQSRLNSKDYTTVDDNWYNSNIHDLCFISGFGDEQIFDIKCSTKRQIDTINEGRNELKNDYYSTLKYINFSKM